MNKSKLLPLRTSPRAPHKKSESEEKEVAHKKSNRVLIPSIGSTAHVPDRPLLLKEEGWVRGQGEFGIKKGPHKALSPLPFQKAMQEKLPVPACKDVDEKQNRDAIEVMLAESFPSPSKPILSKLDIDASAEKLAQRVAEAKDLAEIDDTRVKRRRSSIEDQAICCEPDRNLTFAPHTLGQLRVGC